MDSTDEPRQCAPSTADAAVVSERVIAGGTGVSLAWLSVGMLLASATPVIVAGARLEGLAVSAWRFWLAGAVFFVLTGARGRFSLRMLVITARAGIAFGVATALFFSALQLTSVANASVISVMQPLPLLLAARFMFGERIALRDITWIGVALAGAVFMVLAADSAGTADLGGDLLAVGSTFLAASYLIFSKRARQTLDTDVFMTGLLFWGGMALTPIVFVSGQAIVPPDGWDWLRLAGVAFIVGFGHMLINFANGRLPLAVIGLFQLFIPVSSGLFAWLILDQQITVWQAVGMAVVLVSLGAHTRYSPASRRNRAGGAATSSTGPPSTIRAR